MSSRATSDLSGALPCRSSFRAGIEVLLLEKFPSPPREALTPAAAPTRPRPAALPGLTIQAGDLVAAPPSWLGSFPHGLNQEHRPDQEEPGVDVAEKRAPRHASVDRPSKDDRRQG